MTAMKIDLPYLYNEPDHRGNPRLYVRKDGRRVRIKAQPGTKEFVAAYSAAIEALGVPKAKRLNAAAAGTFGWLAAQYFANKPFTALDERSQRNRRSVIESCLREPRKPGSKDLMRDCPMHLVGPDHIQMLVDRKDGLPGAANNRLKYLRAMFGWAVPKHLKFNPTRDIKPVRYASAGFFPWNIDHVRQFEERHPIGSKARLALALLLFTGARRSDVVTFGRQHIRGGTLRYVPQKTLYRRSTAIEIPVLPVLERIIAASPTGDLAFLVTEYGQPFTAAGFGGWMRDRCDEAGLPECTAHGLRKAAATIAAEQGATDRQLMAMFGWTSAAQASKYTEAANKRRLAAEAARLLDAGHRENEVCLTTIPFVSHGGLSD